MRRPDPAWLFNLVVGGALAWSMAARAAGPQEVATNLPEVMARPAPPAGFDPLTASDSALAQYGLPRRPEQRLHAPAYQSWARALAADRFRLVPQLLVTNVANGPARDVRRRYATTGTSNNWSGVVQTSAALIYGASSFTSVSTDIIVPRVRQPFGVCSNSYKFSAMWAGLDGWISPDVLQAGLEADAVCSTFGGTTQRDYVWYEWYPANQIEITNLVISPGDDLYVSVAALTATRGSFYIVDESTGQSAALTFSAPSGTAFLGNSIEWITERPTVKNIDSTLADYTSVYYSFAYGYTLGGAFTTVGSSPSGDNVLSLTMLDSNDQVESSPFLLGAWALATNVTGSAY